MGVIQCAEDITKEEDLKHKLLHAEKMEVIGRLAGGIAHDFNNVIMSMMGHADLLSMRLDKGNPLSGSIEAIKHAGQSASLLIRQLLAFSRRQVLQPMVLDLNKVIACIETMLEPIMGEGIELTTVLESGIGRVRIDPVQFERVLMNLAMNARDAMPEGGKLLIETGNVEL